MAMLALAVGRERGTVTEAYYNEVSAALLHLPETMDRLHEVFADQRGVPRRAARHENDAPGVHEPVAVVDHARKFHLAGVGVDASADAVDDGPGLLVNLLEHEMGIAALFQLRDQLYKIN